jgi:hypothetical protein
MGLDITVLGKPFPGHEEEFDTLLRSLSIANGVMRDDQPQPGFLGRLLGKGRPRPNATELARLTDRFNAIAVPPYAVLGAPVVGTDASADAWVIEQAAKAGKPPGQAQDTLAEMAGYHVLALAPPCDGLPVYTHGDIGYHVDRTSFRGAFLDPCKDSIPKDDRDAAWTVMTAPELLAFGQRLARHAQNYAGRTGRTAQLGQRRLDWDDPTSPEAQLHVADSLARWAIFWGSRGHGAYPDF